MIVSLTGTVVSSIGGTLVVDVAGIGYAVHVTPAYALAQRVGAKVTVHTSYVVREDAHTLYGFDSIAERDVFEVLLGVSGVGPKSALGVLSGMSPHDIAIAVAAEDDGAFRKVSGIGPKTAKLIIVTLAGKFDASAGQSRSPAVMGTDASVLEALIGLGWPEKAARAALDVTLAGASDADKQSVPTLLRLALTQLAPGSRS